MSFLGGELKPLTGGKTDAQKREEARSAGVGVYQMNSQPIYQESRPGSHLYRQLAQGSNPYISSPNDRYAPLPSSDPLINRGIAVGQGKGEEIYGQTAAETGQNVQDIIRRRREALSANSPEATNIRRARNQSLAMAKARGASSAEQAQIERQGASDIANAEYNRSQQALSNYQKLVGNVLGGQSQLELGYAGLEKSGQYVPAPAVNSGLFGTVICTELFRQGYMSEDMWIKDGQYGELVRCTRPYVYLGYLLLAAPIVGLMKRSEIFTKIVSKPALAWARNMAGEKNFLGNMISKIGEPICGLVGRLIYMEFLYARNKSA